MTEDLTRTGATVYRVDFSSLDVRPSLVAATMGYEDGIVPDPYPEMIHRALEEAPEHADIQAGFRLFPEGSLELGNSGFHLKRTWFAAKRLISGSMLGSTGLAVFAVTAGAPFDDWIRSYFERDDVVTGFLLDSLGTEIAEAAADWIEEKIVEAASAQGFGCTNRFSPGYCGWSVAEQKQLFSFLPDRFCGISLTKSALMIPMKSVSGVVGIGPGVERKDYHCRGCDVEDCYRRRSGKPGTDTGFL